MRITDLKGGARPGFLRHISACQNASLPGNRVPFHIAGSPVGWLGPALAEAAERFPCVRREGDRMILEDPEALPGIAAALSEQGHFRTRGELFDVRAEPEGPVLARIDRGAIPGFGLLALGVHVNGLVRREDGLHVWVGRRAADKHLDPGKLDHITAGGVPSGLTPAQTLEKEALEEAAIPAPLARRARLASRLAYTMERPEGLRRDYLFCYDLNLPPDFIPSPHDGEVTEFHLWPVARAMQAVHDTDEFKFNVNLVLIDLFLRQRLIDEPLAGDLRGALAAGHA